MKVAVTTHYARPEISAASRRISSLQSFLERNGYETRIFAPKKKGVGEVNGVKRFGNFLSLLKSLRKFDTVISTMPPGNISFKTAVACKLLRKPFILDVRDPWTEAQVILGNLKTGSITHRVRRWMELFCFRNAKQVLFVSDYLKNMMKQEFGLNETRLHTAINGYDPNVLKRKLNPEFRKKFGKNPTIVYVGIVGGKELDKFIIECEKTLKQKKIHVVFILVQDKDSEHLIENIKEMVDDKGLSDQFLFLSNLNDEEICEYISSSDFGLNPLPSSLTYCLPIKTFEYMACGTPTISKGPETGPLAELHKKYDIGYYSASWKEFDLKLREAVQKRDLYKKKGIESMKVAERVFTRDKGNQIFLQVIRGISR
jgi:glycosyltransferase involved in cell wall biosynthesis